MELKKNRPYSYKEIEAHFDGGQVYLQKRNGKIVTGCLVRDKNPFAPRVMVVGNKPLNIKRADEFCEQRPTIPVFIKEKVNTWYYHGFYQIENVEFDPKVLRESGKLYGEELNRIIYLKEVGEEDIFEDGDFLVTGKEGQRKLFTHLSRERDAGLAKAKKQSVLRMKGRLECEICGFDFRQFYIGFDKDYAEIHHLDPISSSENERETTLKDLAVLCSNCHSAIHRIDPMPSIPEMRKKVKRQQGNGGNGEGRAVF